MDRFDSLTTSISNITLYDIKAMYNQAKNVVLNISEMESKVREATNDEPWGASSSLMQEIAQGTFNFQHFNEIMPCIYARFMEKEARQWRQIYKALQLLEYLIKHGSERVVDDSRSHLSTIKMLRNFHYIDEKGKDEGLNVRNRAREIVELLSDVENIRLERRKAKSSRHKYTGTGNDPMSFTSGGSRYGGFGSDSVGGGSSSYYGDRMSGRDDFGGSYSGGTSGYRDSTGRKDFEEYTAGDDETVPRRTNSINNGRNNSRANTTPASPLRTQSSSVPPKPKEPEVDLLGGFDEETVPTNTNKALPSLAKGIDDDDFADFQAAPSSPSSPSASSTSSKPTLMEMLNSSPPRPTPAPSMSSIVSSGKPSVTPAFGNVTAALGATATTKQAVTTPVSPSNLWAASRPLSPTGPARSATSVPAANRTSMSHASSPAPAPAKGLSGFEDLWSMSLGTTSSSSAGKHTSTGKSIKDLEKEKAQAGIWASSHKPATSSPMRLGMSSATANSFGNFGPSKTGGASSSGGGDDLLL